MTERDLLVAFVAVGLGAMMVYSAILNEGWCFQMALARKVSERCGPRSVHLDWVDWRICDLARVEHSVWAAIEPTGLERIKSP